MWRQLNFDQVPIEHRQESSRTQPSINLPSFLPTWVLGSLLAGLPWRQGALSSRIRSYGEPARPTAPKQMLYSLAQRISKLLVVMLNRNKIQFQNIELFHKRNYLSLHSSTQVPVFWHFHYPSGIQLLWEVLASGSKGQSHGKLWKSGFENTDLNLGSVFNREPVLRVEHWGDSSQRPGLLSRWLLISVLFGTSSGHVALFLGINCNNKKPGKWGVFKDMSKSKSTCDSGISNTHKALLLCWHHIKGMATLQCKTRIRTQAQA